MSAPPIPPPPPLQYQGSHNNVPPPPPVPPLPPNFTAQVDDYGSSPPHLTDPLIAPRPHKVTPDLPANMARELDEHVAASSSYIEPPPPHNEYYRRPSPQPVNHTPGFMMPHAQPYPPSGPSPQSDLFGWNTSQSPALPYPSPPINQSYSPHAHPSHHRESSSLSSSMAALSFNPAPHPPRPLSSYSSFGPAPKSPSPPRQGGAGLPSLTAPLPTVATLQSALPAIQNPSTDPTVKVSWAHDVLSLVDRITLPQLSTSPAPSSDTDAGPRNITDPALQSLVDIAVPLLLSLCQNSPQPLPKHLAQAVYLRATLAASGSFPQYVPHARRTAFRDFEQAARNGYAPAWFKLGRDYEDFKDAVHAKECFERGVKMNDEACLYRMGMAHLMGQLDLPASAERAVPLLHRAATLATLTCPQPAYVYALLLLDEFSHVSIPPHLFTPYLTPGQTLPQAAKHFLERSAYLNFSPAQYKLGHACEYAQTPFPFDPLLSVQWYSLASQQGEREADMALSKWFLCGAEGCFEKDEALAYTFAEKAARKGLPSAEFAMGYYAEVGVGGPADLEMAKKWYSKASTHGNTDASDRLAALTQATPQSLSRQEHEVLAESQLVRKRTLAKQRSDSRTENNLTQPTDPRNGTKIVEKIRKNSIRDASGRGGRKASGPGGKPRTETPPTMPRIEATPPQTPQPTQQQHPSLAATTGAAQPRLQPLRAHPTAQRFTLVDTGSAPQPRPPGPPRSASYNEGTAGEVGHVEEAPPPPRARPVKGPSTFEEMGIQGAKLEEKDCVIM